jgi:hypothetical protein
LEQAKTTQCEMEESRRASILENTKLGRAVGMVLSEFGTPSESTLTERLLEEASRLPEMIKERELSTARRAVHRVLTIFNSHY